MIAASAWLGCASIAGLDEWNLVEDNAAPDASDGSIVSEQGGECSPGEKRCEGLVPWVCDENARWQSSEPCPSTCLHGECSETCSPGSKECDGNLRRICLPSGQWDAGEACDGDTPICREGECVGSGSASCEGLAEGCGPQGTDSCCASVEVPGGSFFRHNNSSYPATVSSFHLDVYEVTVGRFRRFLEGGHGVRTGAPEVGAGAHPGLAGTGWRSSWNDSLQPTTEDLRAALECGELPTWTDTPGNNENHAVNCVSWLEAFAFCAWDGGRLPTEAEWGYASGGGGDGLGQRVYPWSSPPTSTEIDGNQAVFGGASPPARVGSKSPLGDGRWGHADLAGNIWEWVLDWDGSPVLPCVDCAGLSSSEGRVVCGGAFHNDSYWLRVPVSRDWGSPEAHYDDVGVRCARGPVDEE